jgi:hypothetical protein
MDIWPEEERNKLKYIHKISNSHGGDYKNYCLLGCNTVYLVHIYKHFTVLCLPLACPAYSSTLKMDAVRSSETSVKFYQIIWHHSLEDSTLQENVHFADLYC